MLRGEYIGVSILLNMLTKFGKLTVGKHVVSVRQRSTGESIFPLSIALSGLYPLTKVWVDYLTLPKNTFLIKVNDDDIYSLVKEEPDFDPTKTLTLEVDLDINEKETISGSVSWIVDEVSEKVENALGLQRLTDLRIVGLNCESLVANEFLGLMCCFDLPEQGLDSLEL